MRVAVIAGTRPEIIKLAPVIEQLRARPRIETQVIFTGQHEMAEEMMKTFGITPDERWGVYKMQGANLVGYIQEHERLIEWKPDWMIVQGDTASALGGAILAHGNKIKVAHVEAGLRTYSAMPWPEENYRRMIDIMASLNLTPTKQATKNIKKENLNGVVVETGNTVIDALRWALGRKPKLSVSSDKPLVLVTTHRRENWANITDIANSIASASKDVGDSNWLYSAHPVVINKVRWALADTNIFVTGNVDYVSWVHLMRRADLIITDSGGIQEEAAYLGKKVYLLRGHTERPEVVGVNTELIEHSKLWTRIYSKIYTEQDPAPSHVYGDGWAAVKIVDALEEYGQST